MFMYKGDVLTAPETYTTTGATTTWQAGQAPIYGGSGAGSWNGVAKFSLQQTQLMIYDSTGGLTGLSGAGWLVTSDYWLAAKLKQEGIC
eukprot:gene7145-6352_t